MNLLSTLKQWLLLAASLTVLALLQPNTLAAADSAPTSPPTASPETPILILGDSISAEYGLPRGSGWAALLQKRLMQQGYRYRVVNASISGETSAGGRARIAALLAEHQPGIVVIELGGNDALRGLDLSGTEANLMAIAGAAQKAGARVVVLGMQVPPNYGASYTKQFAQLFANVADRHDGVLVPFLLERIARDDSAFQPDGIHPTTEAQPLILDTAWQGLRKVLEKK